MSETKIMTTCDGIIGLNGHCWKCGKVAMTTSSFCGRLIEVEPSQDELWEELNKDCIRLDISGIPYFLMSEAKKRYRITRITSESKEPKP